ncbi:hypothetical protein, partial [Phaeovulum veldkampii]
GEKLSSMSKFRLSVPLPPELTEWLNDVYPAWLQLPQSTFANLVPFNAAQSPLTLNYAESAADIAASPIFSNLRIFLTLIGEGRITLLEDGTMASDSLDLLLETTSWPNADLTLTKHMRRPLDQENIGALDFLIGLAVASGVAEVADGQIKVTDAGRRVRDNLIDARMVRSVFEAAFLEVNPRTLTKLAYPWVLEQAGIIFWGLSITADTPRTVSEFARYCFVPPKKLLDEKLNVFDVFMRAVYLTPLTWFGLMTATSREGGEVHVYDRLYQKTPLFDRFMNFDLERARPAERPN